MEKVKKIRAVGNSAGVLLDNEMLYKSELKLGDELICKCSKNKITFQKVKEAN